MLESVVCYAGPLFGIFLQPQSKLRSSYTAKQRGMCHKASLQLICLCPLRYLLLVGRHMHFYWFDCAKCHLLKS